MTVLDDIMAEAPSGTVPKLARTPVTAPVYSIGVIPVAFANRSSLAPQKAITQSLGYKDVASIARVFRKITGLAPGVYRERSSLRAVLPEEFAQNGSISKLRVVEGEIRDAFLIMCVLLQLQWPQCDALHKLNLKTL